MARPKRTFIDGAYGQIHLRVARPDRPTKPPLICVHMMPQSGRSFVKLLEAMSVERIVVAPDFPGYGESDPPSRSVTAEDYARSIWDVVDALGLGASHGCVDVFGIHAGAKLAVEATRQRPDEVRKIVLSSAAVLYPDEVAHLKSVLKPIPLDEEGTRFRHLWKLASGNRGGKVSLQMCATAFAEMLRGGDAFLQGHFAVFDYNLTFPDVLKTIRQPVALLNPGDELFEMTPRSMDFLPNAKLINLPDWKHGFLETHTDELAALIREWLDEPQPYTARNAANAPAFSQSTL